MYHCTLMQTNPVQFQVILRGPTHALCEGPYVCANTRKQEKKGVGCVQAKGEKTGGGTKGSPQQLATILVSLQAFPMSLPGRSWQGRSQMVVTQLQCVVIGHKCELVARQLNFA